jgi:parallel beta-helix repeat protein
MNMRQQTLILTLSIILLIAPISNVAHKIHIPHTLENVTTQNQEDTSGGNNGFIQDAIDNASEGDNVYIPEGVYNESIIINKSLHLVGANKLTTIIDGRYCPVIIQILADNVTLENFTIRNTDGHNKNAGIQITKNKCLITNCIIYRTKHAVRIDHGSENRIMDCTILHNGGGIVLQSSTYTIIERCIFAHNAIGITVENSLTTQLYHCHFHTNGLAGVFTDVQEIEVRQCNISNNGDNHGGIVIKHCSQVHITQCMIHHNGIGLFIDESQSILITECQLSENTHFAVYVKKSTENITIRHSEIHQSFRIACYLTEQSQCTIDHTNIYHNYLQGVYCNNAFCTAQHNWWGSPFGPSYTELRRSTRISPPIGSIQYIPWRLQPENPPNIEIPDLPPYSLDIPVEKNYSLNPTDDADNDGVPNWWEEKWGYNPTIWEDHAQLDPDADALTNIQEWYTDQYDSNPYQKDIFLEIDWMQPRNPTRSNKPPAYLIQQLINTFAAHNITLHVDLGDLNGGEEIPLCVSEFSFTKLRDLYWDYFLHNDLTNPRKGIFHYGIICSYCPDLNFPFIGWDQYDSFAISAEWLKEKHPFFPKGRLIVGGAVHQLGSTLGLLVPTYEGNDNLETLKPFTINWWKYRNYRSCMNYRYKYRLLSYSDGSPGSGDFNDWEHLDFKFFQDSSFTLI